MSEPENFLARWSRRKQAAGREAERPRVGPNDEPTPESVGQAPSADTEPQEKKAPEVDLTTLPPVDSIGAGTDIRAYLQKGVPLDLARAALRRAWTADPTIRDFIGIAENQWDFATGSDIPGFGPLEAGDDVRRMVAQIMERSNSSGPEPPAMPKPATERGPQTALEPPHSETAGLEPALQDRPKSEQEKQQARADTAGTGEESVQRDGAASQQDGVVRASNALPGPRRHGRALPR